MSGGKNKRPIINEMPAEELKALRETNPTVNLRITRQNNNNQWATIRPQYVCQVEDILSGALEEYLQGFSGGGSYVIEVRDEQDTGTTLCNRFRITLPGRPIDPKLNPQAPAAFGPQAYASPYASPGGPGAPQGPYAPPNVAQQQSGPIPGVQVPPGAQQAGLPTPQWIGPGQVSLPPQDAIPGWARAQTPGEQWGAFYDSQRKQGRLPDGASIHSDQLAVNQANTWQSQYSSERAENAKLREMLDTIQRQQSEMEKKYERQMSELKETYEKQLHQTEMQQLRDEIRQSRETKNNTDWSALIPGLASLAGVYADVKKTQDQHMHERTLEMQKMQSGQKNDFAELLEKITPFAVPAVKAYFENNSPGAKAEANLESDKAKIMMLQMMSEMVRSQAESSGGMDQWMPLIEGVLGAIGDFTGKTPQLPSGQPQGLPSGESSRQAGGQPASAQAGQPGGQGAHMPSQFDEMDPQAAQMTRMVLQNLPEKAGFHTHEWKTVLFNLHAQLDPDELAPGIIDLLEHCTRYYLVPGVLYEWATKPQETFQELLTKLPISKQAPEYTTRLLDALVSEVRYRAAEAQADAEEQARSQGQPIAGQPSAGGDGGGPQVTPAPASESFSTVDTLPDDEDDAGDADEGADDANTEGADGSDDDQNPQAGPSQPEVH